MTPSRGWSGVEWARWRDGGLVLLHHLETEVIPWLLSCGLERFVDVVGAE